VSLELLSTPGTGLLANLGAVTFDRQIVLSGGGPPLGLPRTTIASPDKIYTTDTINSNHYEIYVPYFMI